MGLCGRPVVQCSDSVIAVQDARTSRAIRRGASSLQGAAQCMAGEAALAAGEHALAEERCGSPIPSPPAAPLLITYRRGEDLHASCSTWSGRSREVGAGDLLRSDTASLGQCRASAAMWPLLGVDTT